MSNCNNCWISCPLQNIKKTKQILDENNWEINLKEFKNQGIKPCKKCISWVKTQVGDILIINL